MIEKKPSIFIAILAIVSFWLAGSAAYFSIHGISMLFSGAFWPVVIMAAAIEAGKLVATSYLYRYWDKTQRVLRIYLSIAVLFTMMITSAGIYGYLSSAYQKSASDIGIFDREILFVEQAKNSIHEKIEANKERIKSIEESKKTVQQNINDATGKLGRDTNSTNIAKIQEGSRVQIAEYNAEIKRIDAETSELFGQVQEQDKKGNELKNKAESVGDIQTFKFIADAVGVTLNTVVKWFMLCIVLVFDPLAVALVLALNVVTVDKSNKKKEIPVSNEEVILTSVPDKIIVQTSDPIVVELPVSKQPVIVSYPDDLVKPEPKELLEDPVIIVELITPTPTNQADDEFTKFIEENTPVAVVENTDAKKKV